MTQSVANTMAATIRASKKGLNLVDQNRRIKGWAKSCEVWADLANTTTATLRRFWRGDAIQAPAFESICTTVGIEDWESIAASESEAANTIEWTAKERLRLLQTLNAFPVAQFPTLVCALNPPQGTIPEVSDSHSQRCQALFDWAASRTGPGLQILDELLSEAIAERAAISPKFTGFVVSGKVDAKTASEAQAIIELLKRTVGNSIEVVFWEEGSIRIVLSGSAEDLRKLQELYELGELSNLAIPTIQKIEQIADDTSIARKARLVTALQSHVKLQDLAVYAQCAHFLAIDLASTLDRARTHSFDRFSVSAIDSAIDRARSLARDIAYSLARDLDLDHARSLARDIAHDLDLARALASALARVSDLARALASALVSDSAIDRAIDSDLNLARNIARNIARDIDLDIATNSDLDLDRAIDSDLDLARNIARNIARARARAARARDIGIARDITRNIARDIDIARDFARDIDRARDIARDIDIARFSVSTIDRARNIDRDLDLSDADLRGANLSNLNLVGIKLTNADLANADVMGTVFGDNAGISEALKRDLERRGAIFQDSPGSDVPVLVRV